MAATIAPPAERVIKRRNRPKVKPMGVIPPGQMWHIDRVREATGWGNAALKTERQRGLPVSYCGGRCFVSTDALIAHIAAQAQTAR